MFQGSMLYAIIVWGALDTHMLLLLLPFPYNYSVADFQNVPIILIPRILVITIWLLQFSGYCFKMTKL